MEKTIIKLMMVLNDLHYRQHMETRKMLKFTNLRIRLLHNLLTEDRSEQDAEAIIKEEREIMEKYDRMVARMERTEEMQEAHIETLRAEIEAMMETED